MVLLTKFTSETFNSYNIQVINDRIFALILASSSNLCFDYPEHRATAFLELSVCGVFFCFVWLRTGISTASEAMFARRHWEHLSGKREQRTGLEAPLNKPALDSEATYQPHMGPKPSCAAHRHPGYRLSYTTSSSSLAFIAALFCTWTYMLL